MKKNEFLRELEISLKDQLSEADINEILSDYNDIFEDGLLENRGEDEISESIGSPAAIAKAIIDDSTNNAPGNTSMPPGPNTSNLAPMSKRFLAYFIDTALIVIIFITFFVAVGSSVIGVSQTSSSTSLNSPFQDTPYKQKVYLDKNKAVDKVKLYKNGKKVFSGKEDKFDHYMQDHLDIKIGTVETVYKSTPRSLDGPGSIISIMPFIVFIPYLFIFMGLGVANIFTAFQLWLFKGYTLGKWLTKIKVVSLDDENITFWGAFLRDLLLKFGVSMLTSGILNIVSFIMGSATPDHKTVHDLAAKTKVINVMR